MAPFCRFCTSTATRSPGPRCWRVCRDEELIELFHGYGYEPHFVEGDDPATMHQLWPPRWTRPRANPEIQRGAREGLQAERPRWPMIVLRTPKGLDRTEDRRRHSDRGNVPRPPGAAGRTSHKPEHLQMLEELDAELQAGGVVRR